MKDDRKTEIRVGVLTILGIIIFMLIFGWAKDIRLFSDKQIIKIKFSSVAGLEVGDRVTVFGIRKGNVETIDLIDNQVLVTAVLDADTKLYDDATISVMMLDMMGGKKIEIDPGKSNKLMDLSKVQDGKFIGDLSTAMAVFSDVQDELVDVVYETKNTISSLNKLFSDEKMISELKESVANLNVLSSKLNKVVSQNEEGIAQIIENSTAITESAEKLLDENKETITTSLSEMKDVIQSSKEMLAKLNKLTDEVTNKENNIGKLLYDDTLVKDLKVIIEQVKSLTVILLDQLQNEGVNVDANIF